MAYILFSIQMFCRHKIFCGHHNSNDTCALVDTFSFVDVVDFKSDDVFKSRWIMTSPVPMTTFIMLSCLHVFCLRFKMIGGSPKFLQDFLQGYSSSRYADIPEDPTEPARLNFLPSQLAMVKKTSSSQGPRRRRNGSESRPRPTSTSSEMTSPCHTSKRSWKIYP